MADRLRAIVDPDHAEPDRDELGDSIADPAPPTPGGDDGSGLDPGP
jgi:hypothetical protein